MFKNIISKDAVKFGIKLVAVVAIATTVGTVLNNAMPEDDKTGKLVYQIGAGIITYAAITQTCDAVENWFS